MNKWDVILLRYPFSTYLATKVRPAVVLSPNGYHQKGNDVLVILITSNTSRNSPHDIIVTTANSEFSQTGLRKDSAIRVSKIMTIEKSAMQMQLGKLGKNLIIEIEKELRSFLQIPPFQQTIY